MLRVLEALPDLKLMANERLVNGQPIVHVANASHGARELKRLPILGKRGNLVFYAGADNEGLVTRVLYKGRLTEYATQSFVEGLADFPIEIETLLGEKDSNQFPALVPKLLRDVPVVQQGPEGVIYLLGGTQTRIAFIPARELATYRG